MSVIILRHIQRFGLASAKGSFLLSSLKKFFGIVFSCEATLYTVLCVCVSQIFVPNSKIYSVHFVSIRQLYQTQPNSKSTILKISHHSQDSHHFVQLWRRNTKIAFNTHLPPNTNFQATSRQGRSLRFCRLTLLTNIRSTKVFFVGLSPSLGWSKSNYNLFYYALIQLSKTLTGQEFASKRSLLDILPKLNTFDLSLVQDGHHASKSRKTKNQISNQK